MSSEASRNIFSDFLRPHRTIPKTSWAAKHRWDLSIPRTGILFFGLFIFGLGDSLLVQSNTGNAPWTVLAQGVANKLDISIGVSTFCYQHFSSSAVDPSARKTRFWNNCKYRNNRKCNSIRCEYLSSCK